MTDDAILAELEDAGLVEQYTNDDGEAAMRLTKRGEHVANQAAMSDAIPAATGWRHRSLGRPTSGGSQAHSGRMVTGERLVKRRG
jgi:hypothetical protein